jgi:hypothetical protein
MRTAFMPLAWQTGQSLGFRHVFPDEPVKGRRGALASPSGPLSPSFKEYVNDMSLLRWNRRDNEPERWFTYSCHAPC